MLWMARSSAVMRMHIRWLFRRNALVLINNIQRMSLLCENRFLVACGEAGLAPSSATRSAFLINVAAFEIQHHCLMQDVGSSRQLMQNNGNGTDVDVVSAPAPAPATAGSPTSTSPAPSLPEGAPANITIVHTPKQLQNAIKQGAVDVEIRSHLDLRELELGFNPVINGLETQNNRKRLAVLYSGPPLRSIRVRSFQSPVQMPAHRFNNGFMITHTKPCLS